MSTKMLFFFIALIALTSCTRGLQFNHERVTDLDLGSIKESGYKDMFGEPYKTSAMNVTGDKFHNIWYTFSVIPILQSPSTRNLFLEFKKEELNGFMYASSFSSDRTRIDLDKADGIQVGKSTKQDVVLLLGRPFGKALCPTQLYDLKEGCTRAKEVWAWVMFGFTGENRAYEKKYAIVMFDETGTVIDFKTQATP